MLRRIKDGELSTGGQEQAFRKLRRERDRRDRRADALGRAVGEVAAERCSAIQASGLPAIDACVLEASYVAGSAALATFMAAVQIHDAPIAPPTVRLLDLGNALAGPDLIAHERGWRVAGWAYWRIFRSLTGCRPSDIEAALEALPPLTTYETGVASMPVEADESPTVFFKVLLDYIHLAALDARPEFPNLQPILVLWDDAWGTGWQAFRDVYDARFPNAWPFP